LIEKKGSPKKEERRKKMKTLRSLSILMVLVLAGMLFCTTVVSAKPTYDISMSLNPG
jgi:hypothetical protein